MNAYTSEDIKDLITGLEYNSDRYPVFVSPYRVLKGKDTFGVHTSISCCNQRLWVFSDTLMSILNGTIKKEPIELDVLDVPNFKMISKVILEVNLEEIPMYINSIPEIAAWRLRVGK